MVTEVKFRLFFNQSGNGQKLSIWSIAKAGERIQLIHPWKENKSIIFNCRFLNSTGWLIFQLNQTTENNSSPIHNRCKPNHRLKKLFQPNRLWFGVFLNRRYSVLLSSRPAPTCGLGLIWSWIHDQFPTQRKYSFSLAN